MKTYSKISIVALVLALAAALMVSCGQQATSSASASASASSSAGQTKEELIAEVEKLVDFKNIKSMSMDMTMEMAQSSSSSSSSSASSSTPTTAMTANVKMEMSDVLKMYMKMQMLGQDMELYVTGENAVLVTNGTAIGGTVEEMGMSQFASIEALMGSQGVPTGDLNEVVDTIEKTTEGSDTVYTLTFNPEKIKEKGAAQGSLTQQDLQMAPESMVVTYRANSAGELTNMAVTMDMSGYSMVANMNMYDYGNTVVPAAPEPTVKYSDVMASQQQQQQ